MRMKTTDYVVIHADFVASMDASFSMRISRVPCIDEYISRDGEEALRIVSVYHCGYDDKYAAYIRVRKT